MKAFRAAELDRFNAAVPVGTAVRYWPVLPYRPGLPPAVETRTRSAAWALGHGDVVVLIDGHSGGVLISHIEIR